ncbi:MAG TPA: M24 family metallopeptidase [Armatimonadota bacterium]|jgi:Xaa-Pro aminopeptidase
MTRLEEVQAKLATLRDWMAREHVGTVVLSTQANFSWITGGGDHKVLSTTDTGVARVVVTATGQYVLTSNIEAPRLADEELVGLPFELVFDNWHEQNDDARLAAVAAGTVASDTAWPAGSVDRSEAISRLQWALLPPEIERYRTNGALCSRALTDTCREIAPGMTEYEIAALLAGKVQAVGVDPIVVLVATDERILKYRHPIPKAKRLEKQAEIVLCGRMNGLVISATRIVHFGPVPAKLADKHRAVCTVDACFNLETTPGAAVKDIFRQAVDTYAATGYADEWCLHHQGGGTGYGSRTYKGGLESPEIVLENQAFAWNPSITGTKSEDTVLTSAQGIEWLSAPVDWPMIEVEWKGFKVGRADILVR